MQLGGGWPQQNVNLTALINDENGQFYLKYAVKRYLRVSHNHMIL